MKINRLTKDSMTITLSKKEIKLIEESFQWVNMISSEMDEFKYQWRNIIENIDQEVEL